MTYVGLRLAPLEHGRDPMSRAIAIAVLVVVPLALALLPSAGPRWDRGHALVAATQPIAAMSVAISLSIGVGPVAGALASVWMSFALLVAWLGVSRLRPSDRGAMAIGLAAGPLMLPVGAAWLVASRIGLRALGFDPVIVLLTAVHFHYAALAMPILVALSLRRAPSRALGASLALLLLGIPLVAAGISFHPALGLVGSVVLAGGLLTHSVVGLARVLPTMRGPLAKRAMAISLLSPFLSMPLAIAWSIAQVEPSLAIPLDLDRMLRLHGQANAHGVVAMGLLAWTLDQSQGTRTSPR